MQDAHVRVRPSIAAPRWALVSTLVVPKPCADNPRPSKQCVPFLKVCLALAIFGFVTLPPPSRDSRIALRGLMLAMGGGFVEPGQQWGMLQRLGMCWFNHLLSMWAAIGLFVATGC